MAIYVVRHGETASNAARILQAPDVPLNARGQEQATRIGRRLATERIALVLSSPLERAAMTAREIARHTQAPLEYDDALQERNFGELRGRPYAEHPIDFFSEDFAPPGGETLGAFHARVALAWTRAVARTDALEGDLVVVTHGLFCSSLATRLLHLPADAKAPRAFRNTSLTIVEPAPPFTVRLLDCAAHLDVALDAGRRHGIV
jgi:2,3-bisphosphoglycerate-dependent phosphoglycerate mutase